jgi:hypothetical protein
MKRGDKFSVLHIANKAKDSFLPPNLKPAHLKNYCEVACSEAAMQRHWRSASRNIQLCPADVVCCFCRPGHGSRDSSGFGSYLVSDRGSGGSDRGLPCPQLGLPRSFYQGRL